MSLESFMNSYRDRIAGSEVLWPFLGKPDALDPASAFGLRQLIGCFMHWLVRRQQLAIAADPGRRVLLTSLVGQPGRTAEIVQELQDVLLPSDVDHRCLAFARHYLAPGPGGLNADYWQYFVEQQDRLNLDDVQLHAANIAAFCGWIDQRLQQFQSGSPALSEPLLPVLQRLPAWTGEAVSDWLSDLGRCTQALAQARPSQHRHALLNWWAVVDAAPDFACAEVASALAQTWLQIDDASVQQAVSRALRQFPIEQVVAGLLPVLPHWAPDSDATCELIGTLQAPWSMAGLEQVGGVLSSAPDHEREAFWRALRQAAEDDNADCRLLLEHLEAIESRAG